MGKVEKPAQKHGESTDQIGSIKKHSFFRLFDVPEAYFKPEALRNLSAAQNAISLHAGNEILAGYTYFGQFVSHDLTKVKRSDAIPSSRPVPTDELIQERTPSLDMDCLYGSGLQDSDVPFEPNGEFYSENTKKKTGSTARDNLEIIDLPRGVGDRGLLARIPDSRNDENFILSRLHVLFMNAHNQLLRRHIDAHGPGPKTFENTRKELTLIYQLIVKHDYLAKIIPDEMLGLLETEPFFLIKGQKETVNPLFNSVPGSEPRIPLEFTGAAFRFGHSMVRSAYFLTEAEKVDPVGLVRLFQLTGRGGLEGGTTNAHVNLDWSKFFDKDTAHHAQGINTQLRPEMQRLLNEMPGNKDLNLRNLLRGNELGLPDAQSCMKFLLGKRPKYKCLQDELIEDSEFPTSTFLDANRPHVDQMELGHIRQASVWDFPNQMPLWTYILMEPSRLKNYKHSRLGVLGSTIVAEVFRSLFISSRTALYNPHTYPEHFCELDYPEKCSKQYDPDCLSEPEIYDKPYSMQKLYKLACGED